MFLSGAGFRSTYEHPNIM
uniref:Uncharacterized protein n=1 Tax=Arundo donax TaxID=35708 RepID=A0A0A9BM80_ARUDO